MLPLPIYKMDYMNTHIHTNIYAARFSYVFFFGVVVADVMFRFFFSCPFFAVKLKSILDEDEQPKKNSLKFKRGLFFFGDIIF